MQPEAQCDVNFASANNDSSPRWLIRHWYIYTRVLIMTMVQLNRMVIINAQQQQNMPMYRFVSNLCNFSSISLLCVCHIKFFVIKSKFYSFVLFIISDTCIALIIMIIICNGVTMRLKSISVFIKRMMGEGEEGVGETMFN